MYYIVETKIGQKVCVIFCELAVRGSKGGDILGLGHVGFMQKISNLV